MSHIYIKKTQQISFTGIVNYFIYDANKLKLFQLAFDTATT